MKPLNETQMQLLSLLSAALFDKPVEGKTDDWKALFREADAHKVFPLVFDVSKAALDNPELLQKGQKLTRHCVAGGLKLSYAHAHLHRLLEENGIAYTIIKGIASARYYPKPELRIAGDVDFYVKTEDFARCRKVLEDNGFSCVRDEKKHVSFTESGVTFELHRFINGLPQNAFGETMQADILSDLIATSVCYDDGQGTVKIPDTFHHGVILLLHTASHMLKEGIGLRHLCDWAVFASSFSEEEFRAVFESRLRAYGLWDFARILSLCTRRYLGAPYCPWQGEAEEAVLEALMCDVMAAGNFGKKDTDRKGQIKYIAERGEGTVKSISPLRQARRTLAKKAAMEQKSQAAVLVQYLKNVLAGKRKPDTVKTVETAAERKVLYSKFRLFEPQKK